MCFEYDLLSAGCYLIKVSDSLKLRCYVLSDAVGVKFYLEKKKLIYIMDILTHT